MLKKDISRKEGFKKNSFKAKKNRPMETWDDSESEASESNSGSSSERESDSEEVFSNFSHSDLEAYLSESLSLYRKFR